MKLPQNNIMPAVIVCITLGGFYWGGGYILYNAFNHTEGGIVDTAKAMSLLDMVVIAAIGLTTGSVGYWLGKNHADQDKDRMLYNSTPSPAPTEQTVNSTIVSKAVPEPEIKP